MRTIYTTKGHVAHNVRPFSLLYPALHSLTSPLPSVAVVPLIRRLGPWASQQNFPFNYANKRTFAAKMGVSLGAAFLLPFVAAGYQL